MYAFSTRCDLPLFSSLFRAKIRTRILSTTFGAIFASNRRPVNLTKKVNLLPPSKYSLPLSGLPLPRVASDICFRSLPFLPSRRCHIIPHRHRRGAILSLHTSSRAFSAQCNWLLARLSPGDPLADRHQASTNENSPEFSQKRKLEGVQAQFYAAAIRQCKMKKKSSFIRSSGEIEGLSTPLLRASVRRI